MGDVVFNRAKGRVVEMVLRVDQTDPTNCRLIIVVLGATGLQSDATLIAYDSLGALLSAANQEVDNTGYARKVLAAADLATPTPDDTNNRQDADLPDITWLTVAADGGQGNWAKLLVCYDPDTTSGTDTDILPLTAHDFVKTPNGNNIVAQINAAGFYRAS